MASQNFLNEDGLQIYDLLIKNVFNEGLSSYINSHNTNEFQPLKSAHETTNNILKLLITHYFTQFDLIKPIAPYGENYSLADIIRIVNCLERGGAVIEDFLPCSTHENGIVPVKFKQNLILNPTGKTSGYPLTISGDTSLIEEEIEWQVFNVDRDEDSENYWSNNFYIEDAYGNPEAPSFELNHPFINYDYGICSDYYSNSPEFLSVEEFNPNFSSFYVGMTKPLTTNLLLYALPDVINPYYNDYSTGCVGERDYENSSTRPYSNAAINCISKAMGQDSSSLGGHQFIGGLKCFSKTQLQKAVDYGFYQGQTFTNVALYDWQEEISSSNDYERYMVIELASKTGANSKTLTFNTVRIQYMRPKSNTTNRGEYVDAATFRQQLADANIHIMLMGVLGGWNISEQYTGSRNFPSREEIIGKQNLLSQYVN